MTAIYIFHLIYLHVSQYYFPGLPCHIALTFPVQSLSNTNILRLPV